MSPTVSGTRTTEGAMLAIWEGNRAGGQGVGAAAGVGGGGGNELAVTDV